MIAAAAAEGLRIGLIATVFGFGFRHGIDWDHIAAITDITGSQETSRTSMFFATLYALGHALVVFILGIGAIVLGENLPSGIDTVLERVVGATLILLGVYVFYSLIKHGRDFRMRSRWMLIFSGIRSGARWMRGRLGRSEKVLIEHDHEHRTDDPDDEALTASPSQDPERSVAVTRRTHAHRHLHRAPMPDDPFMNYGKVTAFLVGMIHGIGAETPTQVLLFFVAAGAGGRGIGLVLLLVFLAGLLASNTLIALTSTFGYLRASRRFALYATVAVLTAVFSLTIGTIFLFGRSTLLPAIFGG
jgi:high-affinity nickel-transport protein